MLMNREIGRHALDLNNDLLSFLLVTVILADMYVFNPSTRMWTELTGAVHGNPPSARYLHGFTLLGGLLYVHGGLGNLYFDSGACFLNPLPVASQS